MISVPLRDWRDYRGLTQRELAATSLVGLATIVRIEAGSEARPSTRRRLAVALGISHEDFMAGPPSRNRG